jgi:acetyltransferase-like isoleucine patch superfamily enzyme
MKRLLKAMLNGMATLAVLPAVMLYRAGALVIGPERAFPGWSQALALVPGYLGFYLRRAFYRLTLRRCSADACIGFGTVISHPSTEIGRRVYVGLFCSLGDVTLEDDVLLASYVSVMNGARQHGVDRLDIPMREQPGIWPRVSIGRDSWIGERSVVMADVGKQCVVGAGAVVSKAVPDLAIAVGVPARVSRFRKSLEDPRPIDKRFGQRESSNLLDRFAGPNC